MKAKKPKRTIYRVMWEKKWLRWIVLCGKIACHTGGEVTKADHIEAAIFLARRSQPSQVLIYSRSRRTGKFRITKEFSYGCDSKRRKG